MSNATQHVIIGAGAVGITAAKTIRALRPQDDVLLISEDERIVSRVMLYKYISGELSVDELSFVPDDFFKANRIKWLRGWTATGLDTKAKKVICGTEEINYDTLLIATGAANVTPPVGALSTTKDVFGLSRKVPAIHSIVTLKPAKNLFYLRDLPDSKAIRKAALSSKKAVVVGAGLVGLGAAYALLKLKMNITVVELEQRVLSRNLDERAAASYQSRFEAEGCEFRLGRKITGTIEGKDGSVKQVTLDDGSTIPCDFLVVATGTRPEITFLEGSGVKCDKGAVVVDRYMATNKPDVYAAGDVTGLSGIWPNAKRMGETAAKNMCGEPAAYEDLFAVKNAVNFFDLATLAIGEVEPAEGDRVEYREDQKRYQKVILRDGCVVGIILQGDISNCGFWQYIIKNDIRVDKINKPIWKISFADFFTLSETGEYRWLTTG